MREGWIETTLGEVGQVNPKEPPLDEQDPFVPMDAVEAGGRWVTYTEPRGKRSGARARAGDTLFARITPCLENGKIGQVPYDLPRVGGSTELIVLRSGPTVEPDFLFMWATWAQTRSIAESLMTGTTGRQRVSASDIEALQISLPPLVEQRRIVDLIAAVDENIAAADTLAKSAQTARSSLLSELLGAGGEDWEERTLEEAAVVNPKEPPLDESDPFIPMDAVQACGRWVTYTEPRGRRGGARARAGDTLFARITPCLENGKVGQVPYELARVGGSTELVVLRAGPEVLPDFLFVWAAWEHTRHAAESLMTGTTGRQRVSAADLGRLAFKVPPLAEQRRIVDLVTGFDESIAAAQRVLTASRDTRSALLADLLYGDHEIPESYDHLLEAS